MNTFGLLRRVLLPCLLLGANGLLAQPQLDNAGFEAWTNVGQATQEPASWSSLKTSDGGAFINGLVPQLCWRSTDAHTGLYSVNLRTVSSVAGTANGLLTNGRVHAELAIENSYMYTVQDDPQWNTPLSSRPDSLIGWFKGTPQPGDRANIGALLHVDEGRLPAFGTEGNYVAGASWKAPFGSTSEWTRFSTPFQYLNEWQPEWILLILTAGDSAGSQVGTQAWFDDLELIYNVQCLPEVPVTYVTASSGAQLLVDFTTGGIPTSPIAFSVELSDPEGSFAAPIVVGSSTSSLASGSILCSIPAGSLPSADYRLRVVTPSPYYAPVPIAFTIETATGAGERNLLEPTVRATEQGVLIDLGALRSHAAQVDLFDARGRIVNTASLMPNEVNLVSTSGMQGMIVVRITHAKGSFVQRVMLP